MPEPRPIPPIPSYLPPAALSRRTGQTPVPGRLLAARVAGNLLVLRQRAGLTQQQLASAAGVSRATVNLLESGNADPRVSTLELIARALGVDPAELTGDEQATGAGGGSGVGRVSAPDGRLT